MEIPSLGDLPHKYQKNIIPFSFPSSSQEIESAIPK